MKLPDQHKMTFWGVLTLLVGGLTALITLFSYWPIVSNFMMKTNFLYKNAPIIYRMAKDHKADSLYDAAITRKIDSLETVIRIIEFGKAPYLDSVWYMDHGIWKEVDIRDHPEMKKYSK